MAAAYLSVSKTTFRDRWHRRTYPQPIRDGKRLLWSRVQLDRFVSAQFGIANDDSDGDETWADLK
ncbi:helix-turn-helix transcriptional regulator [Sphingomonas sp. ID0503]|uniref:helix-turn-helix transcriptional regulator n=1 Tax=Sphingomonas sp. ID0503 TaxID=3399691 RepID=UPI003AFAE4CF